MRDTSGTRTLRHFCRVALARLRRNRTRHSASVRSPCSKLPPKTVSIQPCASRQSGVATSAGECQKAVQEKYSDHQRRGQRHLQRVSGNRGGVSHHLPRRDKTLNCSRNQSSGFGDGRVTGPAARATIARIPLAERWRAPICRAKALRVRTGRSSPGPLPATPALSQTSTASPWPATNPEPVMKMRPRHFRLWAIQHKKKGCENGNI